MDFDCLEDALAYEGQLRWMCSITAIHVAARKLLPDRDQATTIAELALKRLAKHLGVDNTHDAIVSWHDNGNRETVVAGLQAAA